MLTINGGLFHKLNESDGGKVAPSSTDGAAKYPHHQRQDLRPNLAPARRKVAPSTTTAKGEEHDRSTARPSPTGQRRRCAVTSARTSWRLDRPSPATRWRRRRRRRRRSATTRAAAVTVLLLQRQDDRESTDTWQVRRGAASSADGDFEIDARRSRLGKTAEEGRVASTSTATAPSTNSTFTARSPRRAARSYTGNDEMLILSLTYDDRRQHCIRKGPAISRRGCLRRVQSTFGTHHGPGGTNPPSSTTER